MKPFHRAGQAGFAIALSGLLAMPVGGLGDPGRQLVGIDEFRIDEDAFCRIRELWVEELLATHPEGTWAPMKVELTDEMLRLMGLPSAEVLLAQRYPVPTAVFPDGTTIPVDLNLALASYAGNGCLGIRPGAWLLLLNDGSVGWCSMAHVYGSVGNFKISTAGHCGKGGDIGTVIAAVGNFNRPPFEVGEPAVPVPILLDFGKFSSSTDGGIGNDKALISVDAAFQHLVTPTMCFWGGPLGMFTSQGAVVSASLIGNGGRIDPTVSTNANPFLAQPILHYGHGAGLGPGGTPRAGAAIHWSRDHYAFFGAISPGDSGSGSNTLGGDGVLQANEAAGINTHIYVDPSLRTGLGYLAGTRATKVGSSLALGQIVPYPMPAPGLP